MARLLLLLLLRRRTDGSGCDDHNEDAESGIRQRRHWAGLAMALSGTGIAPPDAISSGVGKHRRLLVTVLECRGLKKMDGRFGDNDVFVSVDVDGQELATHTVHDGGTAPRWNGGAGEALLFTPPGEPQMLVVSAYDEDTRLVDKALLRDSSTTQGSRAHRD